jgi:hypothetical protein
LAHPGPARLARHARERILNGGRVQPPLRGWRLSGVKLRKTGPFLLILGAVLVVGCGGVI